jgi:CheY-like chemotaxis protein
MDKMGPILLIDDDPDDIHIAMEALSELGVENRVIAFTSGREALKYLTELHDEQPFLILCEVNMAAMNGLELKSRINDAQLLKNRAIPFIFYSADSNPWMLTKAWDVQNQGFFLKQNTMTDIKASLAKIISYWRHSLLPAKAALPNSNRNLPSQKFKPFGDTKSFPEV